jgi:membrane protease YdiL (CAAX protease family)
MATQPGNLESPDGAGDPPADRDNPIAASLRGFGPLGILAILLILSGNFLFSPLSAVFVLVWMQLSRTPWREIGYVRPKSWVGSLLVGVVFGCAFKFLLKAIVMPLLGAPAINAAYHYLAGNTAALPGMIFTLIVVAGFGEETVYPAGCLNGSASFLDRACGPGHSLCCLLRCYSPWPTTPCKVSPGANRP